MASGNRAFSRGLESVLMPLECQSVLPVIKMLKSHIGEKTNG
jgi:hypothetical protein